jgi:hypothetical protein
VFFAKYNSSDRIKEDKMGRACSKKGKKKKKKKKKKKNVYGILMGKPEKKR